MLHASSRRFLGDHGIRQYFSISLILLRFALLSPRYRHIFDIDSRLAHQVVDSTRMEASDSRQDANMLILLILLFCEKYILNPV